MLTTVAEAAAKSSSWTGHDTRLIVVALAGIALVVLLSAAAKIHPFLALLIGALFVGVAGGISADKLLKSLTTGVGGVLGNVGVIVALGAMLGKLLVDSGGADRLVGAIVDRVGERRAPWAMVLAAMVIGIPMFFEVGLVLMIPIVYLVWRRVGGSILRVGIPALAGLSILHGLIPPHPGPLVAISALKADLGTTLLLGVIVAIPTAIIAGPVYGSFISRRVQPTPPEQLATQYSAAEREDGRPAPSVLTTLSVILLPVAIMLVKTVIDLVVTDPKAEVHRVMDFIGDPITAMIIGVIWAMIAFRFGRSRSGEIMGAALAPIAGILLIIGAGGGFKQMLVDTGIADSIGKAANHSHLSLLLLAWLIAVAIRLATGSATVATVTASGIIAPILLTSNHTSAALVALAVGSGSLFLSHVNDAGFWLVKEFFGMDVKETFASWSAMETILSCVSIVVILILGTFVH
ncbi:GntP family permease [Nocardia sp. BMG111209]|uniref:GntP family permease n=1 Tax=Nocardia sp. BMG111209 TaxID=1160137 RepID=UPI000379DEA5|nr:gluconate:H+ symporter [Nocardia sp. BMG111209]